jgi:CheY-like chemotaxis protein
LAPGLSCLVGSPPAPSPSEEDEGPGSASPIRGVRILVVDDDPRAVGVLAAVLAADGHEVHVATNGLMALARVHRRSYDLILCDLRMPELDGPGFYRELKRWRPDLLSRVVFLSDGDDAQAASAVADAACAPRMLKPFTRGDIHRVTQEILRTL